MVEFVSELVSELGFNFPQRSYRDGTLVLKSKRLMKWERHSWKVTGHTNFGNKMYKIVKVIP